MNTKINENQIFISHRSTDKEVTEMLVDFLVGSGIPKQVIFCSSLPGNDINEKISTEVKNALKSSKIDIAILSQEYYQSAYCLNEAGILWYKENTTVIPIALPEINYTNMHGFLNSEYKLRQLDCDDDIAYIYDAIHKALSISKTKTSIIFQESNKLKAKYKTHLENRKSSQLLNTSSFQDYLSDITTDDERILLYYILTKNIRKIKQEDIVDWLRINEIHDIDVENAFDLLSSFEGGNINNDTLELGINFFRKYTSIGTTLLPKLQAFVNKHTILASNKFKELWLDNKIDSTIKLFISYIIDEKIESLGDRWMEKSQIESIKFWEKKNLLDSILSDNYRYCLDFFIQNKFVYPSQWTSYGNAKDYTLYPSLHQYFMSYPKDIIDELEKNKTVHSYCLPF